MILVDINILVYARVASFAQHGAAKAWLDSKLAGTASVGLPWPCLLGFVRLTVDPRVFEYPLTMKEAWQQGEDWLDLPPVWIPAPAEHHRRILGPLLAEAGNNRNLVPDAHLAALALEHGLILCSADTDFARFPGLRWENPLRPASRRD